MEREEKGETKGKKNSSRREARAYERTNEPTWSQRGERENARLDSAGERGLLRRKRRQRGRRIGGREGEGRAAGK